VIDALPLLRCGPDGLSAATGVSARTASRVLARRGQPRLAQLDRIRGELIRPSKQTAVRYERDRPGELVRMDVKKLGRIPDGGGWRVAGGGWRMRGRERPRPSRVRPRSATTALHSLVDDHSRLAYSEVCPDEKGEDCAGFLPGPRLTLPTTASPASSD